LLETHCTPSAESRRLGLMLPRLFWSAKGAASAKAVDEGRIMTFGTIPNRVIMAVALRGHATRHETEAARDRGERGADALLAGLAENQATLTGRTRRLFPAAGSSL
jgi:hypothetical protein